jgi:hypothetical protein
MLRSLVLATSLALPQASSASCCKIHETCIAGDTCCTTRGHSYVSQHTCKSALPCRSLAPHLTAPLCSPGLIVGPFCKIHAQPPADPGIDRSRLAYPGRRWGRDRGCGWDALRNTCIVGGSSMGEVPSWLRDATELLRPRGTTNSRPTIKHNA